MTWSSVFAAFKTSLWLTPLLMCVIFCGLLLFVGVKEYGWMVLVKVAAIVNSEAVQQIPSELTTLAREWLQELRPAKKRGEK